MLVLAADTATAINTVALCDGKELVAESIVKAGRRHSERLLATVDGLLNEAGVSLDTVEALAISIGPGSFTGLRVGVSTWKGLALAKGLPLVPVPTLEALAETAGCATGLVCPLLDARMDEVFGAVFHFAEGRRRRTVSDRVCSIDAVLDTISDAALFLGDGAVKYRSRIAKRFPGARFAAPSLYLPRGAAVAKVAIERLERGERPAARDAAPVYLRRSQAELAQREGRQETVSP